ncbi:MAG: hypothetical protein IPF92_30885 [Myxococcales bacterium]|nr:hypothetical protein [Myxococcales bacterium]
MKHVSLLVVSLVLGATGVFAGCVGDSPVAADGGAPTATATGTGTTPVPDASVKDTSAPDTSVPDTSTPDTSAPDAPVAFDPKAVPGLALWLDPAEGVTDTAGKVSAWADKSPAGLAVAQATAANQPAKGNLGGKPVLVFSDSTWLASPAATVGNKLDFGVGDLTVVVVCSMEPTTSNVLAGVLYKVPDVAVPPFDGLQVYGNLAGGGRPGAGLAGEGLILTASAGSTVADGKLHVLALRRAGNALTLRLDGTQVAAMTATARSVDSVSPLQVGGRAAITHNFANKLADVLIYRGAVSATDFASLEGFVRTKNGI